MSVEPHDPTRAGPPVPTASAEGVVFSLSEIQAECLKAARGRGLPWGLAEEAGMAASWLAAAGLPGPEAMLRLLEDSLRDPPAVVAGTWRGARGGLLCPLRTGCALTDFCALPAGLGGGALTLVDVAHPLLLLPFAAQVAGRLEQRIGVEWPGFAALLAENGCRISASAPGAERAPRATVSLARNDAGAVITPLGREGRRVSLDVWRRLDELAMRTTVPATARSQADAGAAASDND